MGKFQAKLYFLSLGGNGIFSFYITAQLRKRVANMNNFHSLEHC
jgi:hypothetical protein